MKKIWIPIIVVMIIIVAVAVFYKPAPKETIKIGILEPFSGTRAEAGAYFKKGLDIALPEINNDENKKYKLELIYEDTQYDPKLAVSGFNKLKDINGVKYIIGAMGSSETLAITPLAQENKIILITPGSQSSEISKAGDYIFRTQISTSHEAPFLAQFIAKKTTKNKVHILGLNTDYSISYLNDFTPVFEAVGGQIGLVEKFNPADTDYRTQLLKIEAQNPEFILILGLPKNAGFILKQAKELDIKATFFAGSPVEGKDLITTAGQTADGLLYAYPFDDNSNISSMKLYRDKYMSKYNEKPEMLSANIYDTLHLLSICFEKTGDSVDSVKNCLYTIKDYQGASGVLSFDQNGDVVKPMMIKTIKNGQFVPYTE